MKKDIQAKIDALRVASVGGGDGADTNAIKKGTEELSREMQKIGEALAKQQPTGGDAKGAEGNVRDADYKEEKGEEGKDTQK